MKKLGFLLLMIVMLFTIGCVSRRINERIPTEDEMDIFINPY